MKILLINNYNNFAQTGAAANRWRTLIEGLAKYDVEFFLIITSGYKSHEEKLKYGKKGYIDDKIRYVYSAGQNLYGYWVGRINHYLLSPLYLFVNKRIVKKKIKDFSPEIVFISSSLDAFKIVEAIFPGGHKGFKLMMEMNEYNDIWDTHATNKLQRLLNKQYKFYLEHIIFPQLDLCLVMTETLKIHYSHFPRLKKGLAFFDVPMTVDLNRFENVSSSIKFNKPYIAYCGSSSFIGDGVDILIRSFCNISEDYPDLTLYIAAFWEIDGEKMLRLIYDCRMNDRIKYVGVLARDEVPAFLVNARILALPRPDSRQARGGFPTKLGEYLASRNPVCVSSVGEIPRYLTDNESAFMSIPGDLESFTDSLKRALGNESHAKIVGENGRRVAEEYFNMDIQATRLYGFLEANLSRG